MRRELETEEIAADRKEAKHRGGPSTPSQNFRFE